MDSDVLQWAQAHAAAARGVVARSFQFGGRGAEQPTSAANEMNSTVTEAIVGV
jgi:hypothetical protein